jgi:hypothetical protein
MLKLSEAQGLQVENLLAEIDVREKHMGKVFDVGGVRGKELRSKGFYLESLIINSQVVEHYIKLTIEGYAAKRRILNLLGEKDIYADVTLKTDDEAPLGPLIGKLRALDADPSLARKLDNLNEMRKEAVHHICDGTKDIAIFNDQAKKYVTGQEFRDVVLGIASIQQKVREEIKKLTGK